MPSTSTCSPISGRSSATSRRWPRRPKRPRSQQLTQRTSATATSPDQTTTGASRPRLSFVPAAGAGPAVDDARPGGAPDVRVGLEARRLDLPAARPALLPGPRARLPRCLGARLHLGEMLGADDPLRIGHWPPPQGRMTLTGSGANE